MLRFPDRIHKRPFIVGVLVLAFICIVAFTAVILLRLFATSHDAPIVTILKTKADISVRDIGLNIDYLPGANILGNPSFENSQFDTIYTVAGSDEGSVFVSPEELTKDQIGNGFYTGGSIRVFSVDETGKLISKLQSEVIDYSMNQLGMWTILPLPSDLPDQAVILDTAASSTKTVGIVSGGIIISNMNSTEPELVLTENAEVPVAIAAASDRFCAVTSSGTFLCSADGLSWQSVSPEDDQPGDIHTVVMLGKLAIAAGDYGRVLMLSGAQTQEIDINVNSSFRASAGNTDVIILVGDNGLIQVSTNGLLFRSLEDSELRLSSELPDWTCADSNSGKFILAGTLGEVAVGSYDADSGKFLFNTFLATDESGKPIEAKQVTVLSTGEALLLDTSGKLYCSDGGYTDWKLMNTESTSQTDSIGTTDSGKIILNQGIFSRLTQLFTEISIENMQDEKTIRPGDKCLLSIDAPSISTDLKQNLWQLGGDNSDVTVQASASPGCGSYSIRITGNQNASPQDPHYISQMISKKGDDVFTDNSFYQIKVWLKQSGISNGQAMTWISGTTYPIGTTFTDVGTGWRQYTYTFVLPAGAAIKANEDIRFNIGFYGLGELYVDKVYFGLAENAETLVSEEIVTEISNAYPGMIRLDNVQIGRMDVCADGWLQTVGNETQESDNFTNGISSLETSLTIVRNAKADPWIVIDSAADEQTIAKLLGYMCGLLSDPYGKQRADNGTAVPWSMQFDRIVFEISDTDGIFQTDIERSAYVNYVISIISNSAYYLDIQDKVYFLDGMEYVNKAMISSADSHTWDIDVMNQNLDDGMLLSFDQAVSSAYSLYYDQIPRVPFTAKRPAGSAEEWVRSASILLYSAQKQDNKTIILHDTISAADYAYVILSDFGQHTSCLMTDLDVAYPEIDTVSGNLLKSSDIMTEDSVLNHNQKTLLRVLSFLGNSVAGYRTDLTVNTSSTTEKDNSGLKTYAFSDDISAHFIAANTSSEPILFVLNSSWPMDGDLYTKYGSDGNEIESSKLSQRNNQITLMPGQVFVTEITY